jgi:hypothetical protein
MRAAIILVSFVFVACGGGSSGPTEAPITMTAAGLSTSAVTIPTGGRVHFFNKDTASHQITSPDPGCADLDTPTLAPGADSLRPTMAGPLSCTFKDALTSSAAFNGSVTVAAPGTISTDGGSGY